MVPVVTMNKGMFPDIAPFETIRVPCGNASIDGSKIIIGYTWINTDTLESGYVSGNASFVSADGNPVILLKDVVTTHLGGGGPVLGE